MVGERWADLQAGLLEEEMAMLEDKVCAVGGWVLEGFGGERNKVKWPTSQVCKTREGVKLVLVFLELWFLANGKSQFWAEGGGRGDPGEEGEAVALGQPASAEQSLTQVPQCGSPK
jgi:hypothetical protein